MGELVPLSVQRDAWNQLNGMDLPEHNDALSRPDAERINASYDIYIAGGVHGQGEGSSLLVRPTQREYEASAKLIDGMRPGDTLFTEQYGFDEPVIDSPIEQFDKFNPVPLTGDLLLDTPIQLINSIAEAVKNISPMIIAQHRAQLEALRQSYKIDCWTYATGLAYLKGIKVVHADKDAFNAAADASTLGSDMMELITSDDADKRAKAERVHSTREKAVFSIVKDYALKHLPQVETRHDDGSSTKPKPKLVVLWGRMHLPELEELFDEKGLKTVAFNMDATPDMISRMVEQMNYTTMNMIHGLGSEVLSQLVQSEPNKPELNASRITTKRITAERLDKKKRINPYLDEHMEHSKSA